MESLTPDVIALGLVWYAVFLFSTTVHEAAHALTAYKLGDPTAYSGGQVTLNPLPHIQRAPFGTVVVPLLSYFLAGWMMGWASAPYDPWWANRYPKRAAWMALAGPTANLLLVLLAGLAIRIGLAMEAFVPPDPFSLSISNIVTAQSPGLESLATFLSILFSLNLLLFAFNLIPVPPLDGSGVLPLFMKDTVAQRYLEVMQQPMWSFLGIVVAWRIFGVVFNPVFGVALRLLYSGS